MSSSDTWNRRQRHYVADKLGSDTEVVELMLVAAHHVVTLRTGLTAGCTLELPSNSNGNVYCSSSTGTA
jgi:hypothetical protein